MKFLSLKRLLKAFGHSWEGLSVSLREEVSLQLELFAFVLLTVIAFGLHISPFERLLLISSMLLVIIVELLNTAIETLTDRISTEPHPLSKKIKDAASAAVLVSLVLSVAAWSTVLLEL